MNEGTPRDAAGILSGREQDEQDIVLQDEQELAGCEQDSSG